MDKFINWCNDNQGFLTLILSISTILVSIVAIIVSIRTARLPYSKKGILNATLNHIVLKNSNQPIPFQVELSFSNIGNCPICLHTLAIGFKLKKDIYQIYTIDDGNIPEQIVPPAGNVRFQYTLATIINFLNSELAQENPRINLNTRLIIFARDTEGRTYKKTYKTVEEIIELPQTKISV